MEMRIHLGAEQNQNTNTKTTSTRLYTGIPTGRRQRRIDRVIEPVSYTRRERGGPPRSALVSHIKSSDTRSAAEEENIGSGATRACEGHAGNGAHGKRPSSARIFSSRPEPGARPRRKEGKRERERENGYACAYPWWGEVEHSTILTGLN